LGLWGPIGTKSWTGGAACGDLASRLRGTISVEQAMCGCPLLQCSTQPGRRRSIASAAGIVPICMRPACDAAHGRADAVGEHTRAEQHPARNSVTGKKGSFTCTISLSARSEAASITTCRLRCRLAGGARRGQVRRAVSLVACGSLWRGPLILGFHSRSWGLARASKARSAATPPCDGPSAPGSRAVPRRRDDAPHRLWPRRRNALYPHST
jgi:hypothetical protein